MATNVFKDLNLTLGKHPNTGDFLKINDVNAVKQSLKNILQMGPFDTPFDPIGGGNIRKFLFELITPTTIATIKKHLLLALAQEPRAIIQDLYVGESESKNGINIGILFFVAGNNEQQVLNFNLERVR